jgi:hypothetical protein
VAKTVSYKYNGKKMVTTLTYSQTQTMYTFVYIKLKLIEGVKKVAFGENLQLHFLLSGILALIKYNGKKMVTTLTYSQTCGSKCKLVAH